ncbi:MAG: glycosyltransferase family 4 protein [Candidatus Sericytochromatia bacterium]|nr:glycosyltransferase family 4 protein [Candidatus Tanganyikabacteria bacterium]
MRVALVTPQLAGGGIATYTATLAAGLAEIGHAVLVLAPGSGPDAGSTRPRPAPPPPLPEPGQCLLRRLTVGAPRFGRRWYANLGRVLGFARAVAEAGRSLAGSFDVLEAPEWDAPGLLVAASGRLPVVTRLHGHLRLVRLLNGERLSIEDRLLAALERETIRRATLCAANSTYLARRGAADHGIPGDRIAVLPLGVDVTRFRPGDGAGARAALGLPQGVPIVGFAGRLEPRKGLPAVMAAWRHVMREHPLAVLAVAGAAAGGRDGAESAALRNLRLALPPGHLKYLGNLDHARMPDFHRAVDVLAAPSAGEPFGIVVLEALATGRPVVAAASGGIPEIVDDGVHGFLVPHGDADALAAALARLLGNDLMRIKMGEAGRAQAIGAFSARRQACRATEAYEIANRAWRA